MWHPRTSRSRVLMPPWRRGDIDAAVAYFAKDAVMVLVPIMDEAPPPWADKEALVGREEIGAWLSYLAADNSSMDIYDLKTAEHRAMFAGHFRGDHFKEMGMDPRALRRCRHHRGRPDPRPHVVLSRFL